MKVTQGGGICFGIKPKPNVTADCKGGASESDIIGRSNLF